MISISIVSHGQFELTRLLLDDLEKYCANQIEVILTLNIPEAIPDNLTTAYTFTLKIITNIYPKGFGANHNQAFREISGNVFCVLNPDIRLVNNPFAELTKYTSGVVAPQIIDEQGYIQDNGREFLTPLKLLKRVLARNKAIIKNSDHPDWVAGMFMVFPKAIFQKMGGFDEKYFMYCEDMDLCWRLRQQNYSVTLAQNVKAIHTAQRSSHKKLKFLYWHIKSLLIYFFTT